MWQDTPSSENLYVGKGEFLFDRADDVTGLTSGVYRHLGNVSSGETTTDDDTIKKYSSMNASASLYRETNRRRDVTLALRMDEFHPENLAMQQMGAVQTLVQSATPVVGEALAATTVPGGYVQLSQLGPYTAVDVKFGAVSGVQGTDWEWHNATAGTIRILPGTAQTGAVTADYTPTAYTTVNGPKVIGGGGSGKILGKALFIGDPTTGPKMQVKFHKVSIAPDGALAWIGDDYGSLGVTLSLLDDSTNNPPPNHLYTTTYLP